jgi:hypothetical protein
LCLTLFIKALLFFFSFFSFWNRIQKHSLHARTHEQNDEEDNQPKNMRLKNIEKSRPAILSTHRKECGRGKEEKKRRRQKRTPVNN